MSPAALSDQVYPAGLSLWLSNSKPATRKLRYVGQRPLTAMRLIDSARFEIQRPSPRFTHISVIRACGRIALSCPKHYGRPVTYLFFYSALRGF